MKKTLIALAFLFLTLPLYAQHTTVTGQVKDTLNQPYRTCTGSANFAGQNTTPGAGPYTLNGGTFQQTVPINCDGSGRFTTSLADNNVVTPAPSQWSFTFCSAIGVYPGPPICFTTLITITGVAQDITNQLQAASALLPPYTVKLETNGTPNGSQSLLNLIAGSNITIVDNGSGGVTISSSGGGGGGGTCTNCLPDPGSNGLVYRSALNTTAAVPNNSTVGAFYVSTGSSTLPSTQTNPVYDLRNYSCAQNGSTDDSTCLSNVLNTIGSNNGTILFTGPTSQESITYPPNVKLKFEQAGALKPISSSTPPGGAGFVQGAGASNVNTLTSSCSVTLTGVASGDTIVVMENHFFTGATIPFGAVTDNQGGHYLQLVQQGFNFSSVNSGWARSNVSSGTITVTVPYGTSVANGCIAWEISGMGPVVAAEASATSPESPSGSLVMSAGAITTTTGALVIGFGGQSYLNQASCTPAAGFTQPAGAAGFISGGSQPSTGYGFNLCATYKLASPGGSQTATQTITNDPLNLGLNKYWAYATASVLPSSSVINVQGPIDAPPQQIFTNALPTQGTIDFSNNYVLDKVFPEWWGASPLATAATNTPALQAAIVGAFGNNRSNGSGANGFNRKFELLGLYNINGTLSINHMNGFIWECQENLSCGLNQTATNTTILSTTTGGSYGVFRDMSFTTTASQDINHPLAELDYTGVPSIDLRPEYIRFDRVNWGGAGVAAIGLRGAKSGGGAQYSTISNIDNIWGGFTEAGYMIGSGQNCVASTLATNAVGINIIGGDFVNNYNFGIEWFGAGEVQLYGTTFEGGTSPPNATQTGYDMCGQTGAAGEIFVVNSVRSESLYMFNGGPYSVTDSFNTDGAYRLAPGATPATNAVIEGSASAGHGAFQKVTAGGTWLGVGTESVPVIATSGTGTTLVNTNQSIAGANTIGLFVIGETVTQATSGSTGTLLNIPISLGTITGSVTSGTIGASHTMTQATTGITCTSENAPTGTTSLLVQQCSGTADSSHVWTDGTTGGTYTPSAAPVFAAASPVMVITAATGSPDASHNWTGGTSGAVLVPSGSPTNTANYTVNQWVGYYLTLVGQPPTQHGAMQYCIITANTATAFTCSGGWLTDFPDYVTITNPDTTTTYMVEPQWGTQTTSGSVTWTPVVKTIGGFIHADNVFIPGLKVIVQPHATISNFQVTRPDWNGAAGFPFDSTGLTGGVSGVLAGTSGPGLGVINNGFFYRLKNTRHGVTETGYPVQDLKGSNLVEHWQAGGLGGGISTLDTYFGGDANASAGNFRGRQFIENNSNNGGFFWYFNYDGSTTFPATTGTAPFNVSSTTVVPNLNVSQLLGGTWAVPGTIGSTTPNSGAFTTLSSSGLATLGSGATKSIATTTASNTDLTGEISFSGVTTGSYSFTGTYTSHPECVATPQFDIGASNRVWITYTSTTSFTVNFNSAETGSVSYICIGRN